MAPLPRSSVNNANVDVVAERLDALRCDVQEIKNILTEQARESRSRDERMIVMSTRLDAAHGRIDALDKWRDSVDKLVPLMRAELWLVGAMAVPVITAIIYIVQQYMAAKASGVIQ